jgi:DNA replication protein DnaT
MAGDWLKVEKDTPEKPEILALATALNITTEEAFGRCFKVWRWADSHTVDGNARVTQMCALDSIAGLDGFSQALLDVGWLQARSGSLVIPHFDRHMGQSGKRRALTASRVAEHRAKTGNAGVTPDALPEKR